MESKKPTLRDGQKAFTRQRLLDAARAMFYRDGYHATTIDQIVSEIGASRQTFYHHFSSKDEILGVLIEAYTTLGAGVMRRFPYPDPTHAGIRAWLLELSTFFESQRPAFAILAEVSTRSNNQQDYGKATLEVGTNAIDLWLRALAEVVPAFASALEQGARGVAALARARLLILQMIWTGSLAWERKGSALAEETLGVMADGLFGFVSDPCFNGAQSPVRVG